MESVQFKLTSYNKELRSPEGTTVGVKRQAPAQNGRTDFQEGLSPHPTFKRSGHTSGLSKQPRHLPPDRRQHSPKAIQGSGFCTLAKVGPGQKGWSSECTGLCQGQGRDGRPESQLNRQLWVEVDQGFLVLCPPAHSQLSLLSEPQTGGSGEAQRAACSLGQGQPAERSDKDSLVRPASCPRQREWRTGLQL